jgi:DNA-binding transcriptional MerR regulator
MNTPQAQGGLSITQLAAHASVRPDTIRYYERTGLLPAPARTAGDHRRYDERALDRLQFIRGAKRLGLRLDAIAELLELRGRLDEVDAEMARLATLRTQLEQMLAGIPGPPRAGRPAACRRAAACRDRAPGRPVPELLCRARGARVTGSSSAVPGARGMLEPGSPQSCRQARLACQLAWLSLGYITVDAIRTLVTGERPGTSWPSIGLSIVSVIVMPLLGTAKKRIGAQFGSAAVSGEGAGNILCAWMGAAVLARLAALGVFLIIDTLLH